MTNSRISSLHSPSRVHMIRLKPHADLKQTLIRFANDNKLKAAIVLSCAGSLEQYNLRFANERSGSSKAGHFEIVSLTGTLSESSAHIHISVSDHSGATIGGHLLDDNLIYTTAEIAIGELTRLEFVRIFDPATGHKELEIRPLHYDAGT